MSVDVVQTLGIPETCWTQSTLQDSSIRVNFSSVEVIKTPRTNKQEYGYI